MLALLRSQVVLSALTLLVAANTIWATGSTFSRSTFALPDSGRRHDITHASTDVATILPAGSRRHLSAADSVRIADFAALPADLKGVFNVPEIELDGRVQGSAAGDGLEQARELSKVLEKELAEKPAPGSQITDELQFPGANVKGSGAIGDPGFPTAWAPSRGGWVFRTADHPGPPGVVLHFSNMTLVLPDATYAGVHASGFMDFLDLGEFGHVCFTNSVLVLSSCAGYDENTYKMWCCTSSRCGIVFTQDRIDELGIDTNDPVDFLPCYGLDD